MKSNTQVPEHLRELYAETVDKVNSDKHQILSNILNKYGDVLSKHEHALGRTNLVEHATDTDNAQPIKQPTRRLQLTYAGEDKKALEQLPKQGSKRPSTSPWGSPIILVKQKNGVDYRRLDAD